MNKVVSYRIFEFERECPIQIWMSWLENKYTTTTNLNMADRFQLRRHESTTAKVITSTLRFTNPEMEFWQERGNIEQICLHNLKKCFNNVSKNRKEENYE